jgi:hypothetical protein
MAALQPVELGMGFSTRLDWRHANISPGRISVPLGGDPDDDWLDRFQAARLEANRARTLGRLPHVQIELRDGELAASGIRDEDHESVKRLLGTLVDAANETTGRHGRSGRAG